VFGSGLCSYSRSLAMNDRSGGDESGTYQKPFRRVAAQYDTGHSVRAQHGTAPGDAGIFEAESASGNPPKPPIRSYPLGTKSDWAVP